MSEEDLQIAEKRRDAKGKGERERNAQLNAEFQKRAKRDFKKGFLNEQCKEIEENNRMEKTRVFQEIYFLNFFQSLQDNWRYQGNILCKDGHD